LNWVLSPSWLILASIADPTNGLSSPRCLASVRLPNYYLSRERLTTTGRVVGRYCS
jgi:hypothetical protein